MPELSTRPVSWRTISGYRDAEPNDGPPHPNDEAHGIVAPGRFITGVAANVTHDDFVSLGLMSMRVSTDNTRLEDWRMDKFGTDKNRRDPRFNDPFELEWKLPEWQVLVGVGFDVYDTNVHTIQLHGRQLDLKARQLVGPIWKTGITRSGNPGSPHIERSAVLPGSWSRRVVVGIHPDCHDSNVVKLRIHYADIE